VGGCGRGRGFFFYSCEFSISIERHVSKPHQMFVHLTVEIKKKNFYVEF